MEDLILEDQAEGETVDLGSLPYQEETVTLPGLLYSPLALLPRDGPVEPQLFPMEDPAH